jgi:uncharacterized membrane protein required for colicin V production
MVINIGILLLLIGYLSAGYKDGFVHTLGRLVGSVAGFLIARTWSISVSFLVGILLPSGWARFITFLIIFVMVNRVIGFVFHILEGPLRIVTFIPFLKSINNLLGSVVGFVEGVIMLGGVIWVIGNFDLFPNFAIQLNSSFLAPLISKAFNFLLTFVM